MENLPAPFSPAGGGAGGRGGSLDSLPADMSQSTATRTYVHIYQQAGLIKCA